jgi:hypothetical protein
MRDLEHSETREQQSERTGALPCPFCGIVSENTTVGTIYHPNNGCMLGGKVFSKEFWNKRAALVSSQTTKD